MSERAAKRPIERKLAFAVLAVGTIGCLLASFGPIWAVRVAVAVAAAMAYGAVALAWHELSVVRKAHRLQLKAAQDSVVAASDKHRADSIEMIDRFNARTAQLRDVITRLRGELSSARAELSSMRGNSVWLRGEVAERQARIDQLAERIAELESRLAASEGVTESVIHALPRFAASGRRGQLPTAAEIWPDGDFPTVVDLSAIVFPARDAEAREA